MDVWFCSDAHFKHKNICKYTERNSFTTSEEHDDWLVVQWNKYVKPDDMVYHLGDFCFSAKDFKVFVSRLNGIKCFIKGNHDSSKVIQDVVNMPMVTSFSEYKEIRINEQAIVLCHFPFTVWHKQHHGSWNLFGHCHGGLLGVGKQLDVGFDNAYKVLGEHRPFSFQEVLKYMDDRAMFIPDQHKEREGEVK